VQQQCELLGVPRSTYYYQPQPESAENLRLMRQLDELYLKCPFFGSRKMAVELEINRKRDFSERYMIFKVKILLSIVSFLLLIAPSAAADFTYQEYAKAPELWKRGFVFGISRYMSAVAQPDEEAPYPMRTAFQRCLANSTDTLLVRQVEIKAECFDKRIVLTN